MPNPKVSIIIPVYNVEKYISQCLDSAINQSLKDIEIIIVDDCGSDKSMDIAKEYAKNDNRIKIIKNSYNQGPFTSRNNAVLAANGEYLVFLDSDDFLDLRACEIAYNAIKDGGGYDIVQFSAYNYENGNTTIFDKILENDSFESLEEYANYMYRQKGYPRWNLAFILIKRDIYLKAFEILDLKCRITMAEDALMSFVLWNLSNKFCHICDILYYYRQNENSTTRSKNDEIISRNSKDRVFVIHKIKAISKKYKFNSKIAKVFVENLKYYEYCDRLMYCKINKIVFKIYDKYFRFKRRLRVKFGV
ncbi:lipooligosaccharide biosynthesis glycosyltransferase [Campylobacter devanensis]|uniref:Glycosyltransferase, family 2 n=1 Tax=Campylobacter devanensis TaxID=3161138 RepID=A0A1X9SQF1_9BACT|nr:glycosyltransferase family 2 protein [Campylobacter lanienae]ARQ98474.1 glycosyltransferase, family 2 [Campylobacter lanienae]SUX01521.1 lipooligosaccharide biosynthesis glycosyltransferase [Campylobacter lanienae]